MNQVLQVEDARRELEALLPEGWGCAITFRLGYGEAEEHTVRRHVDGVLRPLS